MYLKYCVCRDNSAMKMTVTQQYFVTLASYMYNVITFTIVMIILTNLCSLLRIAFRLYRETGYVMIQQCILRTCSHSEHAYRLLKMTTIGDFSCLLIWYNIYCSIIVIYFGNATAIVKIRIYHVQEYMFYHKNIL